MVRRIFGSMLMLFFLLSGAPAWANEFTATTDRTQLGEQETFNLILRYNAQVGFGSPDTTALQRDFQILNQQRSNQFRSVNGKTDSFTQWTLTLLPKRTGTLTVPPVTFEGKSTLPVTIEVSPLPAGVREQLAQEFFFDIRVSPVDALYVQGQLIYTEKLYYRSAHEDPTLSELKVTDARVQALGDVRQYTTVIDGQRLGVYERRFAIFPETAGELVIPGQRFNAQVANPYDRWSRGRQISVVSKPLRLNVLPIPDAYPQAPWLPARKLVLEERFSIPPQQWVAGEAVTRTLIMKAAGLPGSQLPAIALPVIDGLRYYPDQNRHDESNGEQGIDGYAEQSVALVATRDGRLVLPEVRIPWWNTERNQLEYAILPAHSIQVQGGAPATPTADTQATSLPATATSAMSIWLWLASGLLSLALLLSLILNVWLWRRQRRTPVPSVQAGHSGAPDTAALWHTFSNACQNNNAAAMRSSLLNWVNAGGMGPLSQPVSSLTSLSRLTDNPSLQAALAELDAHLFSQQANSAFNGQNLKSLLQTNRLHRSADVTSEPSLYPH